MILDEELMLKITSKNREQIFSGLQVCRRNRKENELTTISDTRKGRHDCDAHICLDLACFALVFLLTSARIDGNPNYL